jgi:hypothetical protein
MKSPAHKHETCTAAEHDSDKGTTQLCGRPAIAFYLSMAHRVPMAVCEEHYFEPTEEESLSYEEYVVLTTMEL